MGATVKKFIALASAIAAFGFVSSASAADMPVKAPVMVAPVYNWTGFYVGINGGGGWNSTSNDIGYFAPATGFAGTSNGFRSRGGFGGGQIGYNWQTGQIVYGLEADFQGSGISDSFNVTVASNGGPLGVNASQRLNYFGTARGRIGYAFDRTLLYATGGFAYGRVNDSILLTNGAATAPLASNTTKTGFVIGAGAEYRFAPTWSVKAEYQYIDLGSQPLSGVSTNGVLLQTTNNVDAKFHTIRIGLNYKFGGA
jgi:outer membrane immunogenic protein